MDIAILIGFGCLLALLICGVLLVTRRERKREPASGGHVPPRPLPRPRAYPPAPPRPGGAYTSSYAPRTPPPARDTDDGPGLMTGIVIGSMLSGGNSHASAAPVEREILPEAPSFTSSGGESAGGGASASWDNGSSGSSSDSSSSSSGSEP